MILDYYFILKECTLDFDLSTYTKEKILVWIRFPCLPVEYYREEFHMKVGEKVDRLVQVDLTTNMVSRVKFSRMCIEIDITKPFLRKFKIKKCTRKNKYEGIPLYASITIYMAIERRFVLPLLLKRILYSMLIRKGKRMCMNHYLR